jgi:Ca2+-binding RTX toxin-like protein
LFGNSVNNSLNGGLGGDTLWAAGSNNGFGQKDTLTGGAGADYFVLGNESGAFYDDGNASNAGAGDYAYITDFVTGDKLVLNGSASNYTLVTGAAIGVNGMTGSGFYGLFREQGATDELIAVLKSTTTLNATNTIETAQFINPIA